MKPRIVQSVNRSLELLLLLVLPFAMVSFTLFPSSSLRIQRLSTRLSKPVLASSIWPKNPLMAQDAIIGSTRWQSKLKSSELSIGMKIKVTLTGQQGKLVEKMKSGWWKCQLYDDIGNIMEKAISVRSTQIEIHSIESEIDSLGSILNTAKVQLNTLQSGIAVNGATTKKSPANETEIPDYDIPHFIPPEMHQNTHQWIIFSDLHVKGSSIETCEHILHEVNRVAKERNAGIIFLGDFWHVRGALSVELLNRVLKVLRTWTQPVIMIPGNHDQVSLGGTIHALEPLFYAFPANQAILLSEPTICLGALWIPYRRDPIVMKSILKASKKYDDINIIFCHADVKGAFMNDNMKCSDGVEVSEFPQNIPIYSGHFHKPHTMKQGDSKLRYVGSPYQTSLSEAGQTKYFYAMATSQKESNMEVIDPLNRIWDESERWDISVGKRYFKASSIDDNELILKARPGDRIVIPVDVGEDARAHTVIEGLREKGIEVDIRYSSNPRFRMQGGMVDPSSAAVKADNAVVGESDGITAPDEMDPVNIYDSFMKTACATSMLNTTIAKTSNMSTEELYNIVHGEGKKIITKLLQTAHAEKEGKETAKQFANKDSVKELKLEEVKIKNFGPFGSGEQITYPLANRGLVLLRGKSSDGTGADSNGSGKTTLAMSVMWALIGSLDTRIVSDGKSIDVAFDTGNPTDRRVAEVTLTGQVNHKPFSITRKRGQKKSDLLFEYDGTNLTKQAQKDTQAVIEDTLGINQNILQRCCFYGQHSHTMESLLGLTDKHMKNELNILVNTDIWLAALNHVKELDKADKTQLQAIQIEMKLRNEERHRQEGKLTENNQFLQQLQHEFNQLSQEKLLTAATGGMTATAATAMMESQLTLAGKQYSSSEEVLIDLDLSQKRIKETVNEINQWRQQLYTQSSMKQSAMKPQEEGLYRLRQQMEAAKELIRNTQRQMDNSNLKQRTNVENSKRLLLSTQTLLASFLEKKDWPKEDRLMALPSLTPQTFRYEELDVYRSQYQSEYEETLKLLATLQLQLKTCQTSLQKLREVKRLIAAGHLQQEGHPHYQHSGENAESCPTCGQTVSQEEQLHREEELMKQLNELKEKLQCYEMDSIFLMRKVDLLTRLKGDYERLRPLADRTKEYEAEIDSHQKIIDERMIFLKEGEGKWKAMKESRDEKEREFNQQEGIIQGQIKLADGTLQGEYDREKRLKQILDNIRRHEQLLSSADNDQKAALTILKDKLHSAKLIVQEKQESLDRLISILGKLDLKRQEIYSHAIIYERLLDIFGTRGIQHYIYMAVIKQIESIANQFLLILADGGIQLVLQADDDADKITKIVLIRSKTDGEYRERALSQLSGGQWRRVSLALDFAFNEVIRMKGLLRCNLLVLDEILSHLDASGREAVGTVLRALAKAQSQHPQLQVGEEIIQQDYIGRAVEYMETDKSLEGMTENEKKNRQLLLEDVAKFLTKSGTFETIIVILQDQVAMELEEAFDHVDVVERDGDISKLRMDVDH